MSGFWRQHDPLLLASRSTVRRKLLEAAGVPLTVAPADLDERALEREADMSSPRAVALMLATAKAHAAAAKAPARLVLGADQTLALGDRIFSKAEDRAAARAQIASLRGRTHELHAAVAVVEAGAVVFSHVATARLTVRDFSDAFLENYLDCVGAAACASVGGYQLESYGVHLFEAIEGDYFTILGLPLLPLLGFFRTAGYLAA
jgi:septum formation protein